jgi:short-subunit dehydrogenase
MRTESRKKCIFITGAASGIGRETARLFADRGWGVGLFDLNEEGLVGLAAELSGAELCHGVLDVRNEEQYRRAVGRFSERFGNRMDALFNCAGVMRMGPFDEVSLADHLLTLEVNALGVVVGIYAALDLLEQTPGAHVLTMGSASGIYGVPDLATYSASKFFVRGLTEALNLELERYGITVTDLMPAYVNTPMLSSQSYQAGSMTRLGVHLQPRQIAELAWKAVHSRRVHWIPGLLAKVLKYAAGAFPPLARPTMKYLNRAG